MYQHPNLEEQMSYNVYLNDLHVEALNSAIFAIRDFIKNLDNEEAKKHNKADATSSDMLLREREKMLMHADILEGIVNRYNSEN
jgi:hypothetical protein